MFSMSIFTSCQNKDNSYLASEAVYGESNVDKDNVIVIEMPNEKVSKDLVIKHAGISDFFENEAIPLITIGEREEYWGYKNLGIANVSNHLNIRQEPNENGKMLGKMSNNDACEILEIDGNWAHVISGKVEGYVCTDYLYTGPLAIQKAKQVVTPVATVTADSVRVREGNSTDSSVITLVQKGEELKVLEQIGDWYRIDLDDEVAYVYASYISVEEKLSTGITMEELSVGAGVSETRVALCKYAQQFIGNPYVWGGTSLTKGADCSGFTMSVYAHFGIKLPHYSQSQAKAGKPVKLADVKPGDLIFYTRGGSINHVAIYIGNGLVCHASSPKTGIKVSNMYYRTPYKAVSLLD